MAILIKKKCAIDAVEILYPNKYIIAKENGLVTWKDGHETTPEETTTINAKIVELQAEYDALAWERSRQGQEGYPSVGDQLDMLMKDMKNNTTTHREACEAVKLKYPKPE